MKPSSPRYICIHGHFYQPPRENPWLEEVEIQESAHPWHDWNQRITVECYQPNAEARILDEHGRLADIINNYEHISFNFGPTLLSWMERHAAETYQAVLAADATSRTRRSGHGNAIAQAYHHMIMPLASRRDKITEVVWGIEDFSRRFRRDPEGMWLPETAVDTETLDILAQHGIRFTILAPRQAARFRSSNREGWVGSTEESIDPTRPYVCRLRGGRVITLFFYQGSIALAIAFGRLLDNGAELTKRLLQGFSNDRPWPQLMHIATDGESYGHHHRFGEMALAYTLKELIDNPGAHLTNYGEFLERHPATAEVEIVQNSSWSCAHGLGRWSEDCGCRLGEKPGWDQSWRTPLRKALDLVRERVDKIFARVSRDVFREVWEARNAYVRVLLEGHESAAAFLAEHGQRRFNDQERVQALSLLEMQRHRMSMYTSCGWFFDDISGIEALQNLKYAARVLQLASSFDRTLKASFLAELACATSNEPPHPTGDQIFREQVMPQAVDLARVAAHVAVCSAFELAPEQDRVFCYSIQVHHSAREMSGPRLLLIRRVSVQNLATTEQAEFSVALVHLGGVDLRCSVKPFAGEQDHQSLTQEISAAFLVHASTDLVRIMDTYFPGDYFSLREMFVEQRVGIIRTATRKVFEEQARMLETFYRRNRELARIIRQNDVPIPEAFSAVASFVLNRAFDLEMRRIERGKFPDKLDSILQEARFWKIGLDTSQAEKIIGDRVVELVRRLQDNPLDEATASEILGFLDLCRARQIPVQLGAAQIVFFRMVQAINPRESHQRQPLFSELGRRLGVRIGKE